MSDGGPREASGPDDLTALVGERLAKYVDLWQSASAKLSSGSYHADDLVDDWFRWLGLVSRDTAAAATLIFGSAARASEGVTGDPGDESATSEDEPGS